MSAVWGLCTAILKYLACHQRLFGRARAWRRRKSRSARRLTLDKPEHDQEREEGTLESAWRVFAPSAAAATSGERACFTATGRLRTLEKSLVWVFVRTDVREKFGTFNGKMTRIAFKTSRIFNMVTSERTSMF